jgi:uncharacterized protein
MRIRVDEIPDSGRFLHLHWDEDKFKEFVPPDDPFELKLARPVNVDLEIYKRADHIRVQGIIEGELQVACHRCLRPFFLPLKETVDLFLMEGQEEDREEEEIELDPEELDYDFFDGEAIEIDGLIAEQIFLSLPFKVLCSESCRGICPRCGVNLNEESCRCEKATEDSPFGGLEKLRRELPPEEGA